MLVLGPNRDPNDVNSAGQVIGSLWIGTVPHPFLWETGVIKDHSLS